jgi:hypothetical protein
MCPLLSEIETNKQKHIFCLFFLLRVSLGGAESRGEQSHSHKHSVLWLLEVDASRIRVHRSDDLIHARQRVHHNHLLLTVFQSFRSDDVDALESVVLIQISETLFLNASDIENVSLAKDLLRELL